MLTSDDFAKLGGKVDDLVKRLSENTAAVQKGTSQAAPTAQGTPVPGRPETAQASRGFEGLSAVKSLLQAGGGIGGAAGGLMEGFQKGGAVGLGKAIVETGKEVGQDYLRIAQAGRDAVRDAPLYSSPQALQSYRSMAERRESIDFTEKHGSLGPIRFEYGKGYTTDKEGNNRFRRFLSAEEERRDRPLEDAASRTYSQFEGFARAGGQVPEETFKQFFDLNLQEARRAQEWRESVRNMSSHLNETSPGINSKYGPR